MILIVRLGYRSARTPSGAASNMLVNLREGFRYVRDRRLIVGTLAVTVVLNFWGFAYITMVPVIGEEVLGLSPFPIGLLMSIEGLGALAGALLAAPLFKPIAYTRLYLSSSFVFLFAVLAFGMSTWFPASLAFNFICGVSLAGFAVMQSTIMFLSAHPEVRSRVMGVLTVCIGVGPLGMLHLGWLADWLGAAVAIQIMAIEGIVALAVTALIWPEMYRATDPSPGPAS